MNERCTCLATAAKPSRICPVHSPGGVVLRFPRAASMLEAMAVAQVFSGAAIELEELAGSAHVYNASTLRRKVRGIVAAAVQLAVEAEGAES
jgi:hypothetical protein